VTDLEHVLRGVVDEGTRLAHRPDPAKLAHRLRYRRTAGTVGIAVAVLALGALALRPSPAPPPGLPPLAVASLVSDAPRADLVVSPLTLRPGDQITVQGNRCLPGERLFIDIGPPVRPRELGWVTADQAGAFRATVRIPADFPTGMTTVWAGCRAPNPAGKLLHQASVTIVG